MIGPFLFEFIQKFNKDLQKNKMIVNVNFIYFIKIKFSNKYYKNKNLL